MLRERIISEAAIAGQCNIPIQMGILQPAGPWPLAAEGPPMGNTPPYTWRKPPIQQPPAAAAAKAPASRCYTMCNSADPGAARSNRYGRVVVLPSHSCLLFKKVSRGQGPYEQ